MTVPRARPPPRSPSAAADWAEARLVLKRAAPVKGLIRLKKGMNDRTHAYVRKGIL